MPEPLTDASARVLLDERKQRAELINRLTRRSPWTRVVVSIAVPLAAGAGFILLTAGEGATPELLAGGVSAAVVSVFVLGMGLADTDRRLAALTRILEQSGTLP